MGRSENKGNQKVISAGPKRISIKVTSNHVCHLCVKHENPDGIRITSLLRGTICNGLGPSAKLPNSVFTTGLVSRALFRGVKESVTAASCRRYLSDMADRLTHLGLFSRRMEYDQRPITQFLSNEGGSAQDINAAPDAPFGADP